MIHVSDLTARSSSGPRIEVGPVSFALDRGTATAFVGSPDDGVELLLAVVAGAVAPRKGAATVDDAPSAPRASIAYVPYVPDLPDVIDVGAYLDLAWRVRGEPRTAARDRLAVLGVAPLADRRIGKLTLAELRTVALVEALTSHARVLLLAEPLAELDPRATGRVATALHARIEAGATAVISTASPVDARLLGGDLLTFHQGKLLARTTRDEAWEPPVGPRGACLRIRSEGARFLLVELAADPTFQEVHAQGAELVVMGRDPVAMASAVANATRHANVELDLLTFEPMDVGA